MDPRAPNFHELESAAKDVIAIMKTIPELAGEKIAAIGGLAMWKYLPDNRRTEDVDFIITAPGAPKWVKDKLFAIQNSPFERRADVFYYRNPNGKEIQIDITAHDASPFLPTGAEVISSVPQHVLPYIGAIDLICFKINSCGLRSVQSKKQRDVIDAMMLLSSLTEKRLPIVDPLSLNDDQKRAALQGLADVIDYSGNPQSWWNERLGLN